MQDSWLLTKQFRINLGLRWDAQYFIDTEGKVAQSITDEFQPRIGFTYQLGKLGLRKLSGSYGRYYEQVPLVFANTYYVKQTGFQIAYDHDPRTNPAGGDTTSFFLATIHPKVPDLQGQYFDEFVLGYEQVLWEHFKFGVRGIYRTLGQVIEDAVDPVLQKYIIGNPGKGNLSFFPKLQRKYEAAEFTIQTSSRTRFNFLASYVLSRNYGDYIGLYDQDYYVAFPNVSPLDLSEQLVNGTGLLPNDRTHVFKLFGSYQFKFGLTAGFSSFVQSGTPLSEFGAASIRGYAIHLRPRGTVGRTPAIWDLNIRLQYNLGNLVKISSKPKLVLDVFHLFTERKGVRYDQFHYFARNRNGDQILPNSNYGKPTRFQPATQVRLGMEMEF